MGTEMYKGWVSDLCSDIGWTVTKLSKAYGIPLRTLFGWNNGTRDAPEYVRTLLERVAREDADKDKGI